MIKTISKHFILFIVIILLGIFLFLSTTNTGLKLIFHTVEHVIPSNLQIQSITGALNRNIAIKQLRYQNKNLTIVGTNLHIKIQPLALLLNQLRLSTLDIKTLTIKSKSTKSTKPTPTESPSFTLPLKLNLENVNIKNLNLQQNNESYLLHKFELNTFIKSNNVNVNSLKALYQQSEFQLQGDIKLSPLSFNLSVHKQTKNKSEFSAKLHAKGTWKKLVINGSTTIPVETKSTLTIYNLLDKASWKLEGQLQKFNVHQYNHKLDYPNITGTFTGTGNTSTATLKAKFLPDANIPESNINLNINSQALSQQAFTASLAWQNLAFPNATTRDITSPQGKIAIKGNLKHYIINSHFNLAGKKMPTSDWQLNGTGNTAKLELNKIMISTLSGSIMGHAQLQWQPSLHYTLSLQANNLNPQEKWADWEGEISFTSQFSGTPQNSRLKINDLKGNLRQQRLSGSASLQLLHKKVNNALLKISLGAANADIKLQRQTYLQTSWNISIPDLAKATPYGSGSLTTKGIFATTATLPTVTGKISGKNLAWLDYQIGAVTCKFQLNLNSNKNSTLQLSAENLKLFHYNLNSIDLTANGNRNRNRHYIKLQLAANKEQLKVHAVGHYAAKEWRLNVSQFTLSGANTNSWSLIDPFNVVYSQHNLKLSDIDWRSGRQSIKGNLTWQQRHLQQTNLTFHDVSLNLLNLFIPNNIKLQGKLNLQARYTTNKDKTTTGTLAATLQNSKINYPIKDQQQTIIIKSGKLYANLKQKTLTSTLDLSLTNQDYLDANLTANNFTFIQGITGKQHLSGTLKSHLSNLEFITLFSPQLESVTGEVKTNLQWNGSLPTPHLTGQLTLQNGSASLPIQGLQLKNIQLIAKASANQINYQLSTKSGDGTLIASSYRV